MLLTCNNRGCLKSSAALLNEETKEIICQECGKPITGISDSMRRTLKSFGQIVRSNIKKAFTMACPNCHANREVVLDQSNSTVCKVCKKPIKVTPAFKLAMESAGVKLEKLEPDEN